MVTGRWTEFSVVTSRAAGGYLGTYTSKVRQYFNQLISFSKSLVVFLRPISVEELVRVEDASSARLSRYEIKIDIFTCLWF